MNNGHMDPLRHRITILVNLIREDEATQQDMDELEQLILNSPEACRIYNDVVYLECGLQWTYGLEENRSPEEQTETLLGPQEAICDLYNLNPEAVWGITAPEEEEPEKPKSSTFGFLGDSFNDGVMSFLHRNIVLVILLVPLLAIGAALWINSSLWETPHKSWTLSARVLQMVDCKWRSDSMQPGIGTLLPSGQRLELQFGLAELEFVSGTKVILEGPVDFTIDGENASSLFSGRVTANVPKGAEGFTIETPEMQVVDLGTEFGIVVEENHNTDVHVFKGTVEVKVAEEIKKPMRNMETLPKTRKLRIQKGQAIKYNKAFDNLIPIPIDKESFVHNLNRSKSLVENLQIENPSFETPRIKTLREYQTVLGSTKFAPIFRWNSSASNLAKPRVAMYQISPYTFPDAIRDVGPGATQGKQVLTILLGVKDVPPGKPRSNWVYQSLGKVTAADVHKKLKLTVDAGPRSACEDHPQGDGIVYAGFALRVNEKQSGQPLGKPGSFRQSGEIERLHQLEATVEITPNIVGEELFVVLLAKDDGSSPNTFEYHFDNVKVEKVD